MWILLQSFDYDHHNQDAPNQLAQRTGSIIQEPCRFKFRRISFRFQFLTATTQMLLDVDWQSLMIPGILSCLPPASQTYTAFYTWHLTICAGIWKYICTTCIIYFIKHVLACTQYMSTTQLSEYMLQPLLLGKENCNFHGVSE